LERALLETLVICEGSQALILRRVERRRHFASPLLNPSTLMGRMKGGG
jgi:hypothetical protein